MKEYRLFIFSVKLSTPPSIYSKKWCSKTVAVVPVKQNRSYSLCPVQLLTRCPGKRSARRAGPRSARGRSSTSTNKRTRIQCCADTGLLLDQRQESNVRKEKRVGRNSWLFLKLKMLIMNIHFKDLSLLTLMHFSLFLVLVCLCCFEWQWGLGWWF